MEQKLFNEIRETFFLRVLSDVYWRPSDVISMFNEATIKAMEKHIEERDREILKTKQEAING